MSVRTIDYEEAIAIMKNERPGCGEKIPYTESEKCEAYDIAISAIGKQIPKKPIKTNDETGIRYTDSYRCPNCGRSFSGTGIASFCYHCGQALRWEE